MTPTTSLRLWLLLCGFSLGAGTVRSARFVIYAEENKSVMIPGVKLTDKTYHELLKESGTRETVAIYHGGPMLVDIYEDRGQFFLENGSFQLRNLTKTDSGTYKHLVNKKIQVETKLIVIGPVETPILKVLNEFSGDACRIMLQCVGSGEHPLRFSFWRYQLQLDKNVTQTDNSSLLLLNRYDPESQGTYTCCLENPVSRKMSADVHVQAQAQDIEDCKKARITWISSLLFVIFGVIVLLSGMYYCYLKPQQKRTVGLLAIYSKISSIIRADEETRLESEERHFQGITGDGGDPEDGSGECV